MASKMTFDEYYGNLPVKTLRLIRKYNVSPADFDLMTDLLGNGTWAGIDEHIVSNSERGYYIGRTF
jgi:hypothetical protein